MSPFPFEVRERDPFKINIRELPVGLDEIGLRNLLIDLGCPHPTAVWITTKRIEGSKTEASKTFAFVEFASTRDTEAAFSRLHRKETCGTKLFCSYSVKRKDSSFNERNIEKEFKAFLETYKPPVVPETYKPPVLPETYKPPVVPEIYKPPVVPEIMVNETGKPLNGSLNGKSDILSVPVESVLGSLVAFLPSQDDNCTWCDGDVDGIRHLHYLVAEKELFDPSISPPPMEEIVCASCGAEKGLKKCTGCHLVYYCSRKCQVKDWTKHATSCIMKSKSPPPASYPSSTNVTPVVSVPTTNLNRHLNTPVNARLEPIQNPLSRVGDVVDGSPLAFIRKLDEERRASAGRNQTAELEAKKKAEEEARAAELKQMQLEEARVAELERKKKEQVDRNLAEAAKKMAELKVIQDLETRKAAETKEVAAKVQFAVPEPEKRVLQLGKKVRGMVVWQDEIDTKMYYLSGDEDTIFNCIAPHTETAGALANIVPKVGMYVIAKSIDDGEYYRAKVTNVSGNSCDVYFIDYGNSNTVPVEGIKPLDGPIAVDKIPPQALKVIGDSDLNQNRLAKLYESGTTSSLTPTAFEGDIYTIRF